MERDEGGEAARRAKRAQQVVNQSRRRPRSLSLSPPGPRRRRRQYGSSESGGNADDGKETSRDGDGSDEGRRGELDFGSPRSSGGDSAFELDFLSSHERAASSESPMAPPRRARKPPSPSPSRRSSVSVSSSSQGRRLSSASPRTTASSSKSPARGSVARSSSGSSVKSNKSNKSTRSNKSSKSSRSSKSDSTKPESVNYPARGTFRVIVSRKNTEEAERESEYNLARDDCRWACSILVESNRLSSRANAAVDIALILAERRTRNILWALDRITDDAPAFDPKTRDESILHTILGTLSDLWNLESREGSGSNGSDMIRSARGNAVSSDLHYVLASIFTFLSWDCTPCTLKSIAAIDRTHANRKARNVRRVILKHPGALCFLMQIVLDTPTSPLALDIASSEEVASDDVSVLGNSQESTMSFCSILPSPPRRSTSQNSQDYTLSSNSTLSSPRNSNASRNSQTTTDNDGFEVPKPVVRSFGDPTRRNRRRRRLQAAAEIQSNEERDEFDFDGSSLMSGIDRILPKPATSDGSDRLSFCGDDVPTPKPTLSIQLSSPKSVKSSSSRSPKFTSPKARSRSQVASVDPARMERLRVRVDQVQKPIEHAHNTDCIGEATDRDWRANFLILKSLWRVLSGKRDDGHSCLDDSDDDTPEEEEELPKMLIVTNEAIGRSGIIPLLCRSLTRMLSLLCRMTSVSEDDAPSDEVLCPRCIAQIHDSATTLMSIIDDVCLFNEPNREMFCVTLCQWDRFCPGRSMVHHMIRTVRHLHNIQEDQVKIQDESRDILSAILLAIVRTMMNVTHENAATANLMSVNVLDEDTPEELLTGVDVLADLFHCLETDSPNRTSSLFFISDEKTRFDLAMHCLNIFANVSERGDVKRAVLRAALPDDSSWLDWVCQWMVRRTDSFRDAMMSKTEREASKGEDDDVIAAGNACVLLACLMIDSKKDDSSTNDKLQRVILRHIPDGDAMFIHNTLNSFCNFYRYSLGDLSIAVISPVRKLMLALKDIPAEPARHIP